MYLIPRNVVTRFQFFPGFGWFELAAVLAGAVAGLGLYALAGVAGASVFVRTALAALPPGAAFFATRPGPDGSSLHDLLHRRRRWSRAQRRYLYVTGRG